MFATVCSFHIVWDETVASPPADGDDALPLKGVVQGETYSGSRPLSITLLVTRRAYRRHLSHCLLSILADCEGPGPYEELRNAYNSVRGKDDVEAPAYDDWTMVGFCDHIFCRWVLN